MANTKITDLPLSLTANNEDRIYIVTDFESGSPTLTGESKQISFSTLTSSITGGTSGTSGSSGSSGESGSSGTSGANGDNGTSGSSGTSGASGSSGTSGANGANGTSGSSGTSGASGSSGTSGANGSPGGNGTSGSSGTSGANGAPGSPGSNGTSGSSGTSGTSPAGSINGTTNNGVTTYNSGTGNLDVEANLTFDGTNLNVGASCLGNVKSNTYSFGSVGGHYISKLLGASDCNTTHLVPTGCQHQFRVGSASNIVIINGSGLCVDGNICYSGTLNSGWTPSDIALKTSVKNIESPIQKIQQLNGVTWTWSDDVSNIIKKEPETGLIAQDVQKVLPQVVMTRDDGYLGLKYENIVGLLVEGVKDLQAQIDEIKIFVGLE